MFALWMTPVDAQLYSIIDETYFVSGGASCVSDTQSYSQLEAFPVSGSLTGVDCPGFGAGGLTDVSSSTSRVATPTGFSLTASQFAGGIPGLSGAFANASIQLDFRVTVPTDARFVTQDFTENFSLWTLELTDLTTASTTPLWTDPFVCEGSGFCPLSGVDLHVSLQPFHTYRIAMTANSGQEDSSTTLQLSAEFRWSTTPQTVVHYSYNAKTTFPGIEDFSGFGLDGTAGPLAVLSTDVPTVGVPPFAGNRSIDSSDPSAEFGNPSGVVTDVRRLLDNTLIERAGGFTLECWFKYNGGGNLNSIFDYAGTEKLTVFGDQLIAAFHGPQIFFGTVVPGEWHYVAVTYDTRGAPLNPDGSIPGWIDTYFDSLTPEAFQVPGAKSSFGDTLDRGLGIGMHPEGFTLDTLDGLVFEPRITLGVLTPSQFQFEEPCTIGFQPSSSIGSAGFFPAVAAADLDRDGYVDIARVGPSDALAVCFNASGGIPGSFTAPVSVGTSGGNPRMRCADLNDDGLADLVVAETQGVVWVQFNGDGGVPGAFGPPVTIGTTPFNWPPDLECADFDGDALLDVAVAQVGTGLTVYFNDLASPGSFSGGTSIGSVAEVAPSLAVGDFDFDRWPDIAIAKSGGDLEVYINNQGGVPGTFSAAQDIGDVVGQGPSLVAADLDGNGLVDLAVAQPGGTLDVYFNGLSFTPGDFEPPFAVASVDGNFPALCVADFNEDRHLDLALAESSGGNFVVYENNRDGTPGTFSSGRVVDGLTVDFRAIVAADFTADGRPDVAIGNTSVDVYTSVCLRSVRGDADDNGLLSVVDAVQILEYLFAGSPEPCVLALDANDDEKVSVSDAVLVLVHLFGGGAAPPPPFPACGIDTTPGSLDCAGAPTQCP
ncbi:MAG: VCBS repeat-containing protein [Planctomycetes bacterium]|nr:VCBS repeat-containing protein [Planctomycetota bacterium]